MTSRRTHRIANVLALLVGACGVLATVVFFVLLSNPRLAFAHSAGDGRIMFHRSTSMSQEAAVDAGAQAWAALQDTPFGQPDHGIDVYILDGGWRARIFLAAVPEAGGLTYPVFSQRNVFLSGADLEAGRLIKYDFVVQPPRDLTYYLVHEITHLRHAEVVGAIGFLLTPHWVREGVPDLAALGPAEPDLMAQAMAGDVLSQQLFGSYPWERACVTRALTQHGMDMESLLATRVGTGAVDGCPDLPRPISD